MREQTVCAGSNAVDQQWRKLNSAVRCSPGRAAKAQVPSSAPCFVDKNAVHGKNLGKHIVFRGFLLLFGQKRDFCVPSKQVSILCCLLIVFNTVREQYEHAFCGIFLAPCRSSSLQYLGIAASSSRQLIQKSCRKKCKAIKSS